MRYLLLSAAVIICLQASAQQNGSQLNNKVERVTSSGVETVQVELFTPATNSSDTFISQYQVYKPLEYNIRQLYSAQPAAIEMTLQAPTGKKYSLQLVTAQPTSADARLKYVDDAGLHNTEIETGLHYQGVVKGAQKSIAAMSVFANGEVMILFSCDEGNFNMGKLETGENKYILYNAHDRLEQIDVNCATPDADSMNVSSRSAAKTTGAIQCKKLRIHWEVDYTFFQAKGTIAATQNYLMGIFNFMQSIYYNDGMAVELSSFKIWTVDDPFTTTTAWDGSWQFGRYWQSQKHTYYGEQPTLIANYAGWQGYANIGAICFPNGYACCNMLGQQSTTYPIFDVDVYLVSHETGHTVGADHTHSCAWNTGPNGTCGSVDNCATQYGGGCGTCYSLTDVNATGFKGTIMSYCGGKINFSEGFGVTISSFMRNEFANSSCFGNVISTELVTKDICNNDGSVTLNYPANNFGVAPYTYTWSNSAITKDIAGLSAPVQYTVSITDSNKCTATDVATIKNYAKPGDGTVLPGSMPYCCKDTSYMVTINATLPAGLSGCQTVAWLRTAQPLMTYADARAAYQNAAPGDLILSDNDTSVNNNTAASITIQSPSNCTGVTEYYYTPFVTRKPTQRSTYTTNSTNPVTIKNGNFDLGTSMTIPAEPNLPSACAAHSTNISDTITVSISNYTGRSNHLSIRISAADKQELYQNITLAGDGVYKIPVVTDDHFQEMTVKAFDFNCPTGGSCTQSSLTMSATRSVIYEAIPALTFDSSCVAGQSVRLAFGPDSCNLHIQDVTQHLWDITLYPNPARQRAILSFYADKAGSANLSISNLLGEAVQLKKVNYNNGRNDIELNTASYHPGVYFIHLKPEQSTGKSVKLLIK